MKRLQNFITIEFTRLRHDDTEIGMDVIHTTTPGIEGKVIYTTTFPSWKDVKEWINGL